jgi:hypothetical protein
MQVILDMLIKNQANKNGRLKKLLKKPSSIKDKRPDRLLINTNISANKMPEPVMKVIPILKLG